MAYCTTAEVQAEFKSLVFTGTLSEATVSRWVDEADAIINGKIGLRYSVPVSGATESLKILKSLSTRMVAERVRNHLKVKTGDPEKDQDGTSAETKAINQMLADIVKGALLLSDATELDGDEGAKDYNDTNDIEHTFEIGEEQW